MNKTTTKCLMTVLLTGLTLPVYAAVEDLETRVDTLEIDVENLTTDLAEIELIPGPKGEPGEAGVDGIMFDGAASGDMQYWNGNAWIMITAPAENANMLSFCEGIPTWTQEGCPTLPPPDPEYMVGDIGPAGGWVIYVTEDGAHGVEAAPFDQDDGSGADWGCHGELVPGTFSDLTGSGAANTDLILAHTCSIEPEFGGKLFGPAHLANDFSLNGYSDWYLPAAEDLYNMWGIINFGDLTRGGYWSSTQTSPGTAYRTNFATGRTLPHSKKNIGKVRAVRTF
jgi:hypothetical protein